MLMTGTEDKLKDLYLEVLRSNGGWMSRSDIANAVGRKTRLYPYDIDKLEEMAQDGLIEIDERPLGLVRVQYFYRIAQS